MNASSKLKNDPRKQSLYIPNSHLESLSSIAKKRERSVSYVVGQAIAFWMQKGSPDVSRETGTAKQ